MWSVVPACPSRLVLHSSAGGPLPVNPAISISGGIRGSPADSSLRVSTSWNSLTPVLLQPVWGPAFSLRQELNLITAYLEAHDTTILGSKHEANMGSCLPSFI